MAGLFADMEKTDIQAERRRTVEAEVYRKDVTELKAKNKKKENYCTFLQIHDKIAYIRGQAAGSREIFLRKLDRHQSVTEE